MEKKLIDVHGSCVSFSILKKETGVGEDRLSDYFVNNRFYSHVNHFGLMTEKMPILPEEKDLADMNPHNARIVVSNMTKDVLDDIKKSKAEYLLIDFYDSARIQWFYTGGWYTHIADLSIAAPKYWDKIKDMVAGCNKLTAVPDEVLKSLIDEYMVFVLSKYGEGKVILNRLTMSRYWIDENGFLQEFGQETDKLGSYRDNERIRHWEQYLIDAYNLPYIDIGKYFVADYAMGHDSLSVHYENAYYASGDRALNKVINCGARYVENLDEEAFADKLDREIITSTGMDNWKNYITAAATTFAVNPVIDSLLQTFSLEELAEYRHVLAKLYRWARDNSGYINDESVAFQERQEKAIQKFEELAGEGL